MTILGIIALVLLIVNAVWGFQTGFKGGWTFWFNFIGSILLVLMAFTTIL